MSSPLPLWEAAKREMEEYHFAADASVQPKWDVPSEIAINVAVSGRFGESNSDSGNPTSIEDYIESATQVIEAGACGIHVDFTWVTDNKGRRLDRDLPPVEAYSQVLEPLRARFGNDFVVNLNVLNGDTFEKCMSPVTSGLAEVAPCAPGHPEAFATHAIQTLETYGVKPELAVHSSGEIELAKRRLIDTGILKGPYNWLILYGLPFNIGRTLISGTWVPDAQDMAQHLFLMVNQIRKIDPTGTISVCASGRSTLYMTTLATMMGLHIRVGTEDTPWKYPNSDERLSDNLQMFNMAKDMAALLGRRPATANEYRALIGKPAR
ncbi:3-keto-5-aminohexanoate cleavage protein [Pseudomonas sp. TH41]|jgi:3-keto-5-aminohexanoate cleavage enzyme|uniref:3-keto-5-aminohexanoate cleavage protein n=1 Tax=Pseudomonas sp. TH41 TaxID=2796405 RepID=UPI001911B589|nr:3-keto-5-aminohexanoate cleavage protein [Pseudomonas sp. TH41]MBK5355800.1 3-keto-5-aminohexanoate cleavage protein [Pseudomonas sp. TH41]